MREYSAVPLREYLQCGRMDERLFEMAPQSLEPLAATPGARGSHTRCLGSYAQCPWQPRPVPVAATPGALAATPGARGSHAGTR